MTDSQLAATNVLKEDPKSFEPSLKNVLQNDKLKWIFIGGKGGVGKTTVSCSLALRLAAVRKSVLLLSTDPAHNASHAFDQKCSRAPTKVAGIDNLFVMEIDPERVEELLPQSFFDDRSALMGIDSKRMMSEALGVIPGVKQALVVYSEVMKMISKGEDPEYDVVVFDTLPGGQTAVSLDSLPDVLENLFTKSVSIRDHFIPLLTMFQPLQVAVSQGLQEAMDGFSEVLACVKKVQVRLRAPQESTFIAVCTPDFLSVYETESMIQQLCERKIDCHNLIVNQLLPEHESGSCKSCHTRQKVQEKYIKQIHDLYEDFHVIKVPLVEHEIKGSDQLKEFSNFLFK